MSAARVEDRVGVECLVHAKDTAPICRRSQAGAVAGGPIERAQALRLHLMKMARIGMIAAGLEQLDRAVRTQVANHQLCRVSVDAALHRVLAEARHPRHG
jgi:hypothetical protein